MDKFNKLYNQLNENQSPNKVDAEVHLSAKSRRGIDIAIWINGGAPIEWTVPMPGKSYDELTDIIDLHRNDIMKLVEKLKGGIDTKIRRLVDETNDQLFK